MENTIKIHVIIPVFNAKKYLREAVCSVLNQPYQGIDIVLVNDGSTDGSAGLCDEIAAQEERVFVIHQENGGVSAARNTGIEYVLKNGAETDYIAFLDADDSWVPKCLDNTFFNTFSQNVDIYAFGSIGASQEKNRFCILASYENTFISNTLNILWDRNGHFSSCLYSYEMIRKYNLRFPSVTKYGEDWMFASICLYLARAAYRSSKYLHIYRYNTSSAMHTRSKLTKIDYYTQIINGWVETDHIINSWSAETGRTSQMGYNLASIYFMDMAAEHYQQWGSKEKLDMVFKEHPYYWLFENMQEKNVSAKQYREHLLMKNHPMRFRLKHNLLGVIAFLKRWLYQFAFVRKWYLRKKYPLTTLPSND